MARSFLIDRGLRVRARNVRLGHDEIDIVVSDGAERIAVEVKTRCGDDPIDAFTPAQARRLRRAAGALGGIRRCDLVLVRVDESGVEVRWIRGV